MLEVGKKYVFTPDSWVYSKTNKFYGWNRHMNFILDHKPHECTSVSKSDSTAVTFDFIKKWSWAEDDFREVIDYNSIINNIKLESAE